ncbi:hypothetical protein COO91_04000 [Nostoc flagelliforme CCNUN1]|uniref:Uncharacterized protein n=1 Tax=Nostoc flagelliforme CCNUN1 TaxID=2038116 RepID=A0A2K8SRV2_9NOSO|nr:hypothetical protein COO91_04000 [Nostoc flagelliforme CCNUN1]
MIVRFFLPCNASFPCNTSSPKRWDIFLVGSPLDKLVEAIAYLTGW